MMDFDPCLKSQHLVVAVILGGDEQEIGSLRFRVAVDRQRLCRRYRKIMAGQPIDDMDREVEICSGCACADDHVVVDDAFVQRQAHAGIALLEKHAKSRIGGNAPAVEDAGFGEKERAGAGGRQQL